MAEHAESKGKQHSAFTRWWLRVFRDLTGLALILIVIAMVAFTFVTIFVFASPKLTLQNERIAKVIGRFAPESVKVGFSSISIEIDRPKGLFWSKTVTFEAKNLCVQYEKTAVDTCLDSVRLVVTGGFDGPREPNEKWYVPRIQKIEPLQVAGARVHVDLTAFPPSRGEKSSFDWLGFVRKEVLPRWDIEGSHVNVSEFRLKKAADSIFTASFDLQPGAGDRDIEAVLHEFRQIGGAFRAQATVTVTRPQDWGADANNHLKDGTQAPVSQHAWKVLASGVLDLDGGRHIRLKGDSDIHDLQNLDFRIQTLFRGISAIQEARLDGKLDHDDFKGHVSIKGGSKQSELQALDFVNCAVTADLGKKLGGVRCGPEQVRLQLRERSLMHRPDLFVLAPRFELKMSHLEFGDHRAADLELSLNMDHIGVAKLDAKLTGHVDITEKLTYNVKGAVDTVVPLFKKIVAMMKVTPYSIPAPFNDLDGAIGVHADVDLNQNKNAAAPAGAIRYQASTRLDSNYQSMHLDVSGQTSFESQKGSLVPNTDMTLTILSLALSLPRFELRAPPAFKPDSRFGPITQKTVEQKLSQVRSVSPSHFKIHVKTATPQAIRLATNLTKSPIPITVDATYDDHSTEKSPVTGSVVVGTTPVELFKRNATVEEIRVDLLGTGDDRLNGRVSINYGDYAISILLLGEIADPQVRFFSDPPLDDDQIVSVLLFGRPQHELGDDEKNSVSNTKAAMADAVLGLGSLYFLASTPVESVGYDPDTGRVIARVGLGGGASIELGAGDQETGSGVGFRKRLSKDFTFRTEVETLGTSGSNTVLALIEWVKRF